VIDDAGALATELEGDGREVLGRRAHDDAPDVAVARVEDVVEALLEQLRRLGHAALDDLHGAAVEVLGHELRDQLGCGGRDLGGLDQRAAAGGQSANQRREGELEGVVPGRDDQGDAQRLGAHAALAGLIDQRRGYALGLHPTREVLLHVDDVVRHERHLRRVGLEARLAHVGGEGVEDVVLMLAHQSQERVELSASPLLGARLATIEAAVELGHERGDLVEGGAGRRKSVRLNAGHVILRVAIIVQSSPRAHGVRRSAVLRHTGSPPRQGRDA